MVPQTVGWTILLGMVVIALLYTLWRWRQHYRANAYRRQALSALESAGRDAVAIAAVLRRTALVAYPRTNVAGLSGEDWLIFLDRTGNGTTFREGPGRAVATAPYQASDTSADEMAEAVATWIRGHRRGVGP
jgi:Ca-activated chloride channel family protein